MNEFNNLGESDEIKLLKFPECVRMRPGMYISGVENTDTILREIIDNSLDEAFTVADTIIIDRDINGYIMVADTGHGMPITYSKELRDGMPITQADLAISALHAGSKFVDNKNATVGANGAGAACCNAVSENFILLSKITSENFDKSTKEVFDLWNSAGPRSKKDLFYIIWYKKGYKYYEGAHKKADIEKIVFSGGKKKTIKELPTGMSTIVMFQPDPEVFVGVTAKPEIPVRNLQYFLIIMEKYYKRKVTIDIEGTVFTSADFNKYQFEFMKQIVPEDSSVNEHVDLYVTFEVDPTLGAKVYNGSVNSLSVDSGVHISYVENCFTEALKAEFGIKHKYLTNGLRLCVIVLASELIFNSQTKEKLKAITKVKQSDFAPIIKEFQKIFRKNSDYWADYVSKLNLYAESMRKIGAAEKAQKMIDAASGNQVYRNKSSFINDFSDATATGPDRWNCSLVIVEGKSPFGALKAGRKDSRYFGLLALRGKVLNTVDKTADEMLRNAELESIFKAIGLGLDVNNVTSDCKTPEEAYQKIKEKSRYGKIIIATDADSDGSQISNLLLYAFSKYARFLLDFGLVYYAMSPIYEQGGKYYYANDPRIPGTDFPVGLDSKKPYHRYKGLGSLLKEDIYDVFYNPATRRLVQITPEGIDYSMGLMEDISNRKSLLYEEGILSNPYNFLDL